MGVRVRVRVGVRVGPAVEEALGVVAVNTGVRAAPGRTGAVVVVGLGEAQADSNPKNKAGMNVIVLCDDLLLV